MSTWAIVACVRKSYRVGVSDPARPDFPELWVSVLSNVNFLYEHCRGQPAQFSYSTLAGKSQLKTSRQKTTSSTFARLWFFDFSAAFP
jgi:hypothetical protein